ncbi:hypothetical protein [Lactobacillus sp. ESL0677]|uniref:AbrB/MazE/SpoVT family DNA-binding domain-containing protein n=1 Tax=Lactobacillus sp. ESL0677 TaxID=2983208 RepID=UPI0023F95D41|nr:hypothetical protein [Lactobacillus sp. ESL0677]WEV37619.1 hypothetical protein OZX76_03435 [Lactobacillus sp. ESL0677]
MIQANNLKTRKQGHSVSITIPAKANVSVDEYYSFEQDENGRLIYTPIKKQNNFWDEVEMTPQDVERDIKDLGFDPSDQSERLGEKIEW